MHAGIQQAEWRAMGREDEAMTLSSGSRVGFTLKVLSCTGSYLPCTCACSQRQRLPLPERCTFQLVAAETVPSSAVLVMVVLQSSRAGAAVRGIKASYAAAAGNTGAAARPQAHPPSLSPIGCTSSPASRYCAIVLLTWPQRTSQCGCLMPAEGSLPSQPPL